MIKENAKSFAHEFKTFALRGSVIDMAIGIVIGAAFGKVVSSLVNDIIMPPIGVLLGGVDFSNLQLVIKNAGSQVVAVRYGSFINTIIDFLIIALSIFVALKVMTKLRLHQKTSVQLTRQEQLLTEIRDLLKK